MQGVGQVWNPFLICDGYKKNLNLLPLYNDFPQLFIFIKVGFLNI